jgi:hypothetical protein
MEISIGIHGSRSINEKLHACLVKYRECEAGAYIKQIKIHGKFMRETKILQQFYLFLNLPLAYCGLEVWYLKN